MFPIAKAGAIEGVYDAQKQKDQAQRRPGLKVRAVSRASDWSLSAYVGSLTARMFIAKVRLPAVAASNTVTPNCVPGGAQNPLSIGGV